MTEQPKLKNCTTCGHRSGVLCNLTGFMWETQRKYPSPACDEKLSGWTPIPNCFSVCISYELLTHIILFVIGLALGAVWTYLYSNYFRHV